MPASYVARWNGSAWSPLGGGANAPIEALTLYQGDLIAGGSFTEVDGVPAGSIARWDGSSWSALGSGMNGAVDDLVVYNGDLIAVGLFTEAGGTAANRIARWNGSAWSALGAGTNDWVRAATVYAGDLVVGGAFATAGGAAASRIARWNGSSWSALGAGLNDMVSGLGVWNGELLAGGAFTEAGGEAAASIARWDGISWSGIGSGLTEPIFRLPRVFAFRVFDDRLYLGGHFETAGGRPAYNVVRLDSLPARPARPTPSPLLLMQANFPNPFEGATTFRFSLPFAARARLTIHDLRGRRVATPLDETRAAGAQNGRDDDGKRLRPGIYFARLESAGSVRVRKVALVP